MSTNQKSAVGLLVGARLEAKPMDRSEISCLPVDCCSPRRMSLYLANMPPPAAILRPRATERRMETYIRVCAPVERGVAVVRRCLDGGATVSGTLGGVR
jgi:hypothetical protein